jgi:hypothetical protein
MLEEVGNRLIARTIELFTTEFGAPPVFPLVPKFRFS